jgi:hypothetical protein
MAKKKASSSPPKPTESEQDLLSHMQHGYGLETDSLGGDPILRRLKDNEVIRPLSANRSTIAMKQRGLITPGKGRDSLTIVWRLKIKIDSNRDLGTLQCTDPRQLTLCVDRA